jgi:hypothetical protein
LKSEEGEQEDVWRSVIQLFPSFHPFLSFPSFPSAMSNIQVLSPHEVRVCGKKFLCRDGTLYIIRDRESDADYDEDEEWMFDAWCGPPVTDEAILRVWNPPAPAQQPANQKQFTSWIGARDALTLTIIAGVGVEFHVMNEEGVWSSEMSNIALNDHALANAFAGTLEEYLDCLVCGLDREPSLTFTDDRTAVTLSMCVVECAAGTLHHDFTLHRVDVPKNILHLLLSHMPPRAVAEGEVFAEDDGDADTVIVDEEEMCSTVPYIPIHVILGVRSSVTAKTANWFKGRGAQ